VLACALVAQPALAGQHCEETHTSLSAQQAQAVIADPEGLRGASWSAFEAAQAAAPLPQEQPLSVIGVLVTERSRVLSPSGRFTWELDRSTYLDQEDFELECEAEALAPAQRELEEHLRHLGVSAREGAPPKVARLLARAREIALGGALV
jgi:uncharacterized protein YjbK